MMHVYNNDGQATRWWDKVVRKKIFLPTTLEKYSEHYRKHAKIGDITSKQAEDLINQLAKLKQLNPRALIENPDTNFIEENKKERYKNFSVALFL